jgi:hypothetical protein
MPREDEHAVKASRNEQFAESLDPKDPVHENWAVIAAFYSALHYVESYFARFGVKCSGHQERFQQFKDDGNIKKAYSSYHYLYTLSVTARYYCSGLPADPYQVAKPHLAAVKQQVEHALKITLKASASAKPQAKKGLIPAEPEKPTPGKPI